MLSRCLHALAISSLLFFLFSPAFAAPDYEEIKVPFTKKSLLGDSTVNLTVKVYKPKTDGRHPLVIINHGAPRDQYDARKTTAAYRAQSRFFVSRGFVVANSLRRGYGTSEGSYAESSGKCTTGELYDATMEAVSDIKAVVDYMKKQPYVDPDRVLMVGQSAGAAASLAYAGKYPADIVGVINFAGGRGSRGPNNVCNESGLVYNFGEYGKTNPHRTLWIYSEGDTYFWPELVKRMHKAYVDEGGKATLMFGPKEYDHHMFSKGIEVWKPWVIGYLSDLKLVQQGREEP